MNEHEDYKRLMPPRSKLFNVAPIGIGTGLCESAESYVCRLAQSHRVPRRTLEKFVNSHGKLIYVDDSSPPVLNSVSSGAKDFIERLAKLTGVHEVRHLGLWRLRNHLTTGHTVRTERAWCAECFAAFREEGVPANLPLVWSLKEYDRCHLHDSPIAFKCPDCDRKAVNSNVPSKFLDRCPVCNADFAAPTQLNDFQAPIDAETSERESIIALSLAQFVEQTSATLNEPSGLGVRQVIDQGVATGKWRNASELSRRAGLPRSTMHLALHQQRRSSLGVLVRIGLAAKVSTASLLYPDLSAPPPPECVAYMGTIGQLRRHGKNDWPEIFRVVGERIAADPDVSLQRLAQDLKVDHATLNRGMRDHGLDFAQRRIERKARRREAGVSDLTVRVVAAAQAIRDRGARVTVLAISAAVRRHRGAPFMKEALARAGLQKNSGH